MNSRRPRGHGHSDLAASSAPPRPARRPPVQRHRGQLGASARTGKHDFSTDAEIHVFVNGKTANGLTYGAVVEIQFDNNEGTVRSPRRSYTSKTMADIDEMYAFIASPTLGQLRFGDEDGPFGGLMNAGFITNFGTGGVYGDWQDFVIRPNRTTTSPGDVGDNIEDHLSVAAVLRLRLRPLLGVQRGRRRRHGLRAASPARTATAPTRRPA